MRPRVLYAADSGGGGGDGYSASGSATTSQGNQQRFDKQGAVTVSTGFQIPKWAWPVLIVGGFLSVIVWLLTRD